jgi:hypothetical protein
MRSMVEGPLLTPICPSTTLRVVPLPNGSADREDEAG